MTFMAFSSIPRALRTVKANQPTPITSCTSSVWSDRKRNRGGGGTLSKEENAKQWKDQRKMHIITYADPSFLIEVSSGTKISLEQELWPRSENTQIY